MPNCSELSRVLFDIAREHVRLGHETIDDVVTSMNGALPAVDRERLVNSINEVMDSNHQDRSDFSRRLDRLKREARRDKVGNEKIAAIQKALAEETELPAGEQRKKSTPTEAIKELNAQIDDLLAHYAKSAPALKAKYEGQIRRATAKLADNGVRISRVKPEAIEQTQELQQLRFERDTKQKEIRQKVERLKEKPRLHKVVEAGNVLRHLMTTGEFSGVGRQALPSLFAFPEKTKTSIHNMFAAFADAQTAHRINEEFKQDWDVQRFHAAGINLLSEVDGSYTNVEEALFGRIADIVPKPLKEAWQKTGGRYTDAFDRAYTTFLNTQRVGVAKGMLEFTNDATPTRAELDSIGHIAMVVTGRLPLASFEKYAPAANAMFFAPRYQASRLLYMVGSPVWKSATPQMRNESLKRFYARPLAAAAGLYAAAQLFYGDDDRFKLTFDPRSSDFGKLVIGDTHVDPLGGLSSNVVFLSRAATGQTVNKRGAVIDIRGKKKKFGAQDIVSNFLRSKTAPLPALVWDWVKGENLVGEEVSVGGTISNVGTPITYHDIYDVLRSDLKLPEKAAVSAGAMFGLGVSVYGNKKGK